MKAAMIDNYGSAKEIQIRENVKTPHVGDNDVLIKTVAVGIQGGDIEARKGYYKLLTGFGRKKKGTLFGIEFSGEIVSLGENVKNITNI